MTSVSPVIRPQLGRLCRLRTTAPQRRLVAPVQTFLAASDRLGVVARIVEPGGEVDRTARTRSPEDARTYCCSERGSPVAAQRHHTERQQINDALNSLRILEREK